MLTKYQVTRFETSLSNCLTDFFKRLELVNDCVDMSDTVCLEETICTTHSILWWLTNSLLATELIDDECDNRYCYDANEEVHC